MKRLNFKVYEIEHGGDLDHAVDAVVAAGGKEVKVLATDYEGEESAVLSALVPDDRKKFVADLENEGVCL